MQLDSFTLLASTGTAVSMLGLGLLYFWNRDRRSTWLLWWGFPLLAGGLAAFPMTSPNWHEDFLAVGVGSAVRVAVIAAMWQGARVFNGRRAIASWVVVPPLVWLALCFVPSFMDSMAMRVVLLSLVQGLFGLFAAYELWRGRDEDLPSRRPAMVVFLSFSALMAVRIAGVNYMPFPMGALLPGDPAWLGGYSLALFFHATFLGLLFIALTKERLELEQRNIALIDPLTGLLNRRALSAQMERDARLRVHGPQATTILVLDLDHFKSVNDRYGHEVGDQVLAVFAAVAETHTRPIDQLYRLGGEEFCILLPDTELRDALVVSERIRRAFATTAVETERGERVTATLSIGVAATRYAGGLESLLAAADSALYEAKARGRNRIVVADTHAESPGDVPAGPVAAAQSRRVA